VAADATRNTVYVGNSLGNSVSVISAFESPSITTASLPDGTVGTAYSSPIVTSGTSSTLTVSAGSLPAGLRLDPVTGVLSGTPTAAGSATFTVTATNAAGTTSQVFTVAVAAAATVAAVPVLASTGFDAVPWVVGGVLVVLAGAVFLILAAQRRRRDSE
jgi:hypothetical protein